VGSYTSVNPGPAFYISGFNLGRATVLLALFAIMITTLNTGMYEV